MKRLLCLIALTWLLMRCATPVAPPGGDRDTEAPQVLVQVPRSGAINYQGDKIELIFNEYISFQGGAERVLITPRMDPQPKFVLKGKKLIINLPEGLDPEVTYSISLLNAITDYREGNVLKLYKCVFTRGASIDSSSLSGVVVNSFDKQVVGNVFVGLFDPNDTSAFLLNKPIYIAPTNDQGQFKVDYVKEGQYKIAALEDKNFNFKLDPPSERVSLTTNPISVGLASVLEQEIQVFLNKKKPQIEGYKVISNNSLYVYFNQEIEEITLDVEQFVENDKVYFNSNNDTLFYHWSTRDLQQLDFVVKLNRNHIDSLNIPLINKPKVKAFYATSGPQDPKKAIVIRTGEYVDYFNASLISLKDSLNEAMEFSVTSDKQKLLLQLSKQYYGNLLLSIDSGAVVFNDGIVSKESFSQQLVTEEVRLKSVLSLTFGKPLISGAMLELYTKENKRIAVLSVSNLTKLDIPELNAGKYTVRIYQDANGNSKWDSGDVKEQRPPESTLVYSKNIEIKENWDKELTLNF